MIDIQFKILESETSNTLAIEFGPRLKCNLIVEGSLKDTQPIVNIINTVYRISEQKQKIIETESKGMMSIPVGIYTRLEIETANLLFQAEEIPTEFNNTVQVEKSYQNLMDNLIQKIPEHTSNKTSEKPLESFLVLLSIPFVQDEEEYTEIIQIHLNALKNLGFKVISFLNQIASSFYSQKEKIVQDNLKDHPIGILLNIGKTSQIGIMDEKILAEGFLDINLGTTTILNHSQAILRDLSIHGIKQETIVKWLINDGRVDGRAPFTMKPFRRKEINITSILNSPKILFDYFGTTRGLENDPNSIVDGITKSLSLTQLKTDKILDKLLKTILITGPGAFFKGIDKKIKEELSKQYPDFEINVIIGDDPINSVSNGLIKYLTIFSKLKAFNLVGDGKEIIIKESQEDKLKIANEILFSLKNYICDLKELRNRSENFATIMEEIPSAIRPVININILQESKSWTVEFNNILNPLLKDARKGMKETEEVADLFKTVGMEISNLPKFIRPTLAKVFSTNVQGLKVVKEVHLENSKNELLAVLINSNLTIQDEFSIADLKNATNLGENLIIKLKDDYLNKYPNFGYINGNFIKYNKINLIEAEKILDIVTDKYFDALTQNNKETTNKFAKQGSEYCIFLIKGHSFFENVNKAEKFKTDIQAFDNMSDLFL